MFANQQQYILSNDRNGRAGTKSMPSLCASFRHAIVCVFYCVFLNTTLCSYRKIRCLFFRISASRNPCVLRGFLDATSIPYRKIRSGLEIGSKMTQNELKNESWDPSVVRTCKRGSPDPLLSPKMERGGSKWSPFEAQNRVPNRVDFWS